MKTRLFGVLFGVNLFIAMIELALGEAQRQTGSLPPG